MAHHTRRILLALAAVLTGFGPTAEAQPLGTFSWQLAPYCNVVTVSVTQDGGVYTLDGYDNQCGAATRGAVSGTAFVNPNGTIGIGLTTVTSPGGVAVHLEAAIDAITLGGTWHDSHGNGGTLLFSPVGAAGSPRPLGTGDLPDGSITGAKLADGAVTGSKIADGSIGASDVNLTELQRRISATCPPDQMMTGVSIDGSVNCAAAAGTGDITAVTAGAGLSGGGADGAVSLAVTFDGPGTAASAARSDHTHERSGSADNIAVGPGVLSRATGVMNTAVGSAALQLNTSGGENVAFGRNALLLNTTGSTNTAIGAHALHDNTEGVGNVAVGISALDANETGSNNTAVGPYALNNLETGRSNIAIGSVAGSILTSGDDNIYIGSSGSSTDNGTIRIGRTNQQTRAYIQGIRGVTTGQANAVGVVIDSAGQLGTVSSSRRTKFDIADLEAPTTAAIQRLRPVQFRYRQPFADGSTPLQYGLIAEEVSDVLPGLVALGEDGQPETVKYHVLPALLLADVQRLERERQRLESALARETARVSDLEHQIEAQARALDELRGLIVRPSR